MKFIHLFNITLGASFRAKAKSLIQTQLLKMSQPLCQNSNSATSGGTANTPVATEWKTLETQVGGHQFTHGEYEHQKLGIVDSGNGLILKSLQNPPRGVRELTFYQKAFNPNCQETDLLELRPFLSPFYGTEENGGAKFLKLANLTSGFKCPCVIDLKMGRVTYDQEATAEKIAHEVEKYPPLKTLGFQITGMMLYNPATRSNERYGKPFCRYLTEENIVHDGLGRFFQLPSGLRRDVVQQLVLKLKKLESWFLKQKTYSFIASSLLIVYEGSESVRRKTSENENLISSGLPEDDTNITSAKETSSNFSDENPNSDTAKDINNTADSNSFTVHIQKQLSEGDAEFEDDRFKKVRVSEVTSTDADGTQNNKVFGSSSGDIVEVHLIDFAHAFPAHGIDHNFLFGLQKLIICLEILSK